jgi:hypothetical protein
VAITTSARVLDQGRHQLVEASDALHPFGQVGLGQASPFLVLDVHVVMSLGPIVAYEHSSHRFLLVIVGCSSPRRPPAR